jgi:tRNA(fMet)-specific endonuclease VapC
MLDTNIVSELIRNPGGRAAQRARAVGDAVCVSVIVAAELRYGCAKKASAQLLRRVEQFLSEVPVLAFDVPGDDAYGAIRVELEATGRPIGSNDLLIAAHAHAVGATVVTANVGEFQRVQGLNVENWLLRGIGEDLAV